MNRLLTLTLALAAIAAAPAAAQRDQAMIDRVTAGELTEALASWWGFAPDDATASLQAAINSGVPRLIVEDMGAPWVVRPIRLVSDQEILFEDGCVLLAKRGAYHGTNDALITASRVANVTLSGYGATFRMWRDDYDNADLYQRAEWRHGLSIRSSRNVQVLGLTIAESGGDGIYLGTATRWVTNQDIVIRDVVCDSNYRQGISVITAEGLLIENTVMRNTSGTPPQAGIDFEPNHASERLVDVVMRNCLTQGNGGHGYHLYLGNLTAQSVPISMRFENCRSVDDANSGYSFQVAPTVDAAVGGSADFIGCSVQGSGGAGISISKPAAQGRVRFVDGSLVDTGGKDTAPILLRSGRDTGDAAGGVELRNLRVQDARDRQPLAYVDFGGVSVRDVTGRLLLVDAQGNEKAVELTPEILAEWLPQTTLRDIPRLPADGALLAPLAGSALGTPVWPWQRRVGHYLVFAGAGDEVTCRAAFSQVGSYSGTEMPVTVTGPSGSVVHETWVPFQSQASVGFTAPETGVYTVVADAGLNRMRWSDWSHPMAITGGGAAVHFIRYSGQLQFHVPAGVTLFGVRLWGEGSGEGVRATLTGPDGTVFGRVDDQVQTYQFEVELSAPSQGQVWTLGTASPSNTAWEDFYVDLRGVPPLLTPRGVPLLTPTAVELDSWGRIKTRYLTK